MTIERDIGSCQLHCFPLCSQVKSESEVIENESKKKWKSNKIENESKKKWKSNKISDSEQKKVKENILAAALFPSLFSRTPGSEKWK